MHSNHEIMHGNKAWQPEDDWAALTGRNVEIYRRGKIIDSGRVEVVTSDGKILWLAQEGADPRRIWEQTVDVRIRIIPERGPVSRRSLPLKEPDWRPPKRAVTSLAPPNFPKGTEKTES